MKVVAIQGSPHKGNTYDRVEQLGEALKALGNIEFEHIALKNANIGSCRGCFSCFQRGEDTCPIHDDMAGIWRKLDEADGAVFASPVYSMHISHLLKRFVDRSAFTFHRPRYFGKYAVGLAVTAALGLDDALRYIRAFAGSWGYEYLGDLRYVDPPRGSGLPGFVQEEDLTEETARKLHHAMATKKPRKLTRNDYLHFYSMRTVYSRMRDHSPADYSYFAERGWLDPKTHYFTPHATGNVLSTLLARFVARMLGRNMDKAMAGSAEPDEPAGE